jgi:cell division protein ZapA (FtsZ GTPase activity inhibitor)
MTTEERLHRLEGIVEGIMVTHRITALENRITSLEARMDLLRQELKGEIGAVENRLQEQINSLRHELKGDINTAPNRIRLYFTGLAVLLAILTLWR